MENITNSESISSTISSHHPFTVWSCFLDWLEISELCITSSLKSNRNLHQTYTSLPGGGRHTFFVRLAISYPLPTSMTATGYLAMPCVASPHNFLRHSYISISFMTCICVDRYIATLHPPPTWSFATRISLRWWALPCGWSLVSYVGVHVNMPIIKQREHVFWGLHSKRVERLGALQHNQSHFWDPSALCGHLGLFTPSWPVASPVSTTPPPAGHGGSSTPS